MAWTTDRYPASMSRRPSRVWLKGGRDCQCSARRWRDEATAIRIAIAIAIAIAKAAKTKAKAKE